MRSGLVGLSLALGTGCGDGTAVLDYATGVNLRSEPLLGLLEVRLWGPQPEGRCPRLRGLGDADLDGVAPDTAYGGGPGRSGDFASRSCDAGGNIRFVGAYELSEEPELTLTIPSGSEDLVIVLGGSPLAQRTLDLSGPLVPGETRAVLWPHPEAVPGAAASLNLLSPTASVTRPSVEDGTLRAVDGGFEFDVPTDAPTDIDRVGYSDLWEVTLFSDAADLALELTIDGVQTTL